MTLTLSLLVIVALLTVDRVCKRQKLSPPPLRLPLIAAIGIPLLSKQLMECDHLPMSICCLVLLNLLSDSTDALQVLVRERACCLHCV